MIESAARTGVPESTVCAGELAVRGFDVTVYDEHVEPGGLGRVAEHLYLQHRFAALDAVAALKPAIGGGRM
mgnify:CR=1 FL=1